MDPDFTPNTSKYSLALGLSSREFPGHWLGVGRNWRSYNAQMEWAASKVVSSLPLRYVSRDWQALGKDSRIHSFDKLLLRTYFELGPVPIAGGYSDKAPLLSPHLHSNRGERHSRVARKCVFDMRGLVKEPLSPTLG